MNFEKLYSKLPDFIKYNPFILDFFMKLSKKLRNLNKKSDIMNSHKQFFELIFIHSNFELKGTARNIQLLYLELLRFVDNVCNKHDINYWLSDGTLLGAFRHGGFIPWDDDIDLSIMREDYEKLIKVLPKEINKYPHLKENCGLTLLKDNYENFFNEFNSVYDIDDDLDLLNDEKFLFLQFAWLKPYVKIDFFPKDYVLEDKLNYFKKNYLAVKYKFNKDIENGKEFDYEFKTNNEKVGFTRTKTKFFNDGFDNLKITPVWLYETDKVFPLEKINFEGYEFNCPKDNFYYLEIMFGSNLMHLPDIIENHSIIPFIENQFNSKEEMDKKFREEIKYLKNINDNFK